MLKYFSAFLLILSISISAQSKIIDSLKNELKQQIPDSTKVDIYLAIGDEYYGSNFDEARSFWEKAYEIAKKTNDLIRIFICRRYIGDAYRDIGNYLEAKKYYLQNLKDVKSISDSLTIQKTYHSMGVLYNNLGEFDKSVSLLIKAAEIAKKRNDKSGLAGLCANIGLNLLSNKEPDKALNYFKQSLQLFTELDNKTQIAGSYLRISRVYIFNKEYNKALEYDFKALEVAKTANNKNMMSLVYSELGATYYDMNKLKEAKQYIEKSNVIKKEMGNKKGLTSSQYTLGLINIKLKNYDESEKQLLDCYDVYIEMDSKEQMMNVQQALSDLYMNWGKYREAYNYYQSYSQLKDSLRSERNTKQIADLETQYRVKEKEDSLSIQKSQLGLKETEISNQRIILIAAIVIVLLLLALWLVTNRNLKQRKKINEQLTELDESKSRFFANISHDLRTPLTLIIAPLQGIIEKIKDKSVQMELKLMQNNSQKLLQLTEEVFELSNLESGKIKINKSSVNLHDLCKRVFFAYQSLAQFRKLNYEFTFRPENVTTALIDVNKFEKILNNMISNAFKYSFSGGTISFNIEAENGNLSFTVKDNGQGIHPDDLPNIFNRYYQTKRKDQPDRGGAGIGLAISKEFARLLNGDIFVKSEWGKGSEFTLSIPFEQGGQIIIPEYDLKEEIDFTDKTIHGYQPILIGGQRPRLLIVEDNLDMSRYLLNTLSESYMCTAAPDGREALNIMQKEKFDLIISDIMMPNMDGFEFRENVITNDEWKLTPFIMLTARTPEEDKIKSFQLGVDDYITKPFNLNELLARIQNLLTNKAERDLWKSENAEEERDKVQTVQEKLLAEAENQVLKNLDNVNFTASELADNLAYSQRQLERLLKKYTGLSPNGFIREIRLHKAYQMLERRQFNTVLEVCYSVGIENPSYFSRKFYERFGKKPSEVISYS